MSLRPTREQAITAAAEIYLEEKLRIETDRAIAAATVDAEHEEAA